MLKKIKHLILCLLDIHEWDGYSHSIRDAVNRENVCCKWCYKKIWYDVQDRQWRKEIK